MAVRGRVDCIRGVVGGGGVLCRGRRVESESTFADVNMDGMAEAKHGVAPHGFLVAIVAAIAHRDGRSVSG